MRHITQDIEIYFSDPDEEYFFFFNDSLKKFQKRDKVFLCKLFPSLNYPYTLGYEKVLLSILITSYTANQSLFAL